MQQPSLTALSKAAARPTPHELPRSNVPQIRRLAEPPLFQENVSRLFCAQDKHNHRRSNMIYAAHRTNLDLQI
jgi:hypothetical protein